MSWLEKIISIFVALVFILFILRYPDKIVDFIELFVNAASNAADALGSAGGK